MEALLKELEGKDITEVIAAGVSKLASVPAGGGAVAAAGGMSLGEASKSVVSQQQPAVMSHVNVGRSALVYIDGVLHRKCSCSPS